MPHCVSERLIGQIKRSSPCSRRGSHLEHFEGFLRTARVLKGGDQAIRYPLVSWLMLTVSSIERHLQDRGGVRKPALRKGLLHHVPKGPSLVTQLLLRAGRPETRHQKSSLALISSTWVRGTSALLPSVKLPIPLEEENGWNPTWGEGASIQLQYL